MSPYEVFYKALSGEVFSSANKIGLAKMAMQEAINSTGREDLSIVIDKNSKSGVDLHLMRGVFPLLPISIRTSQSISGDCNIWNGRCPGMHERNSFYLFASTNKRSKNFGLIASEVIEPPQEELDLLEDFRSAIKEVESKYSEIGMFNPSARFAITQDTTKNPIMGSEEIDDIKALSGEIFNNILWSK